MKNEIKISKNQLLIFLIILITSNLLVWSIFILKRSSNRGKNISSPLFVQIEDEIDLPKFRLISFKESQFFTEKDLNAELNIIIFFTLEDCPLCLYEAEFWGKISNSQNNKDVKFVGITPEKNIMKILRFCNEYGLTFPILYDHESKFKDKILSIKRISGLNIKSPFKIYIHANKILQVEGSIKDLKMQKQLHKRVLELLEKL